MSDVLRLDAISTCETCACWNPSHYNGRGQCRDRSPLVTFTKGSDNPMQTTWPLTQSTDWCGQHKEITDGA